MQALGACLRNDMCKSGELSKPYSAEDGVLRCSPHRYGLTLGRRRSITGHRLLAQP